MGTRERERKRRGREIESECVWERRWGGEERQTEGERENVKNRWRFWISVLGSMCVHAFVCECLAIPAPLRFPVQGLGGWGSGKAKSTSHWHSPSLIIPMKVQSSLTQADTGIKLLQISLPRSLSLSLSLLFPSEWFRRLNSIPYSLFISPHSYRRAKDPIYSNVCTARILTLNVSILRQGCGHAMEPGNMEKM